MGSKGSQTTQNTAQNQTYSAAPQIQGAANQALSQAQSAASQPFQMPAAPVAGFSPLQQQAFNQYQALQGSAQPYYDQAQSLYSQASQPVSAAQVNSFYNPMASNVTAQMENIFGQQNQQNTSNLVQSAGGVGADRIAVGQGNLANQQGLAAGQTYANLYQQALSAAQQQQQTEMGAASGLQGLGTSVLGANLQGTGALYGAGSAQQAQTQAELNSPYQQQLAQLAYPFQTAQYLAGITGGLAPALGGTTIGNANTVTTPPQPSIWNQILGLGTAGVGIYGGLSGGQSLGSIGNMPATGAGSPTDSQSNIYALSQGINPFADGGEVEEPPPMPGAGQVNSIVPKVNMQMGAGHSGPLTGGMTFQQPQSQNSSGSGNSIGSDVASIAKFATMFLKSGGKVQGYDDGGDVPYGWGGWGNKPYPSTISDTVPPPPPPPPPEPPPPPPGPLIRPGSVADRIRSAVTGSGGASAAPAPDPATPSPSTGMPAGSPVPFPGVTGQTPVPPPVTPPPRPFPRIAKPTASAAPPDQGNPRNDAALPYPDALSRDGGQDFTRSPWMALVQAGATMASTPGPLGVAIGKGLQAGAKSLDDQRKELRSEQELNNKAKELYEKAQEHLDKYNKMTPYERGSLAARNREIDQSGAEVPGKPGKFTGADYDRAAKFIQSMNPGLPPEQLQPMIDAEIARRRRALAVGTSAPVQPAPEVSPGTIANAKAAIAAGAKVADVIAKARASGVTLTPDMLQ